MSDTTVEALVWTFGILWLILWCFFLWWFMIHVPNKEWKEWKEKSDKEWKELTKDWPNREKEWEEEKQHE